MSRRGLSGADIRERNIAAILRILRAEGPRSRSGLAQRLGLSRSGMTPIVAEMAERGLVCEQAGAPLGRRSEEHTSELQSRFDLVCRLLLEKKKLYQPQTHETRQNR